MAQNEVVGNPGSQVLSRFICLYGVPRVGIPGRYGRVPPSGRTRTQTSNPREAPLQSRSI